MQGWDFWRWVWWNIAFPSPTVGRKTQMCTWFTQTRRHKYQPYSYGMSPTNHNFSCLHENSWGSAATASVHKFECGRPNQPTDSLKQLKNSGADRKIEGPSFFKANVLKERALKVTSLIHSTGTLLSTPFPWIWFETIPFFNPSVYTVLSNSWRSRWVINLADNAFNMYLQCQKTDRGSRLFSSVR